MFSDPERNIEQLGLQHGQRVVDIGAGSGFYALACAKVVGASGAVYAVDVQQDLLSRLKKEAQAAGLQNVETIWGDAEMEGGTKLGDASADAVLLTNTLFQAEDRQAMVREAARLLKKGGRLLVVDWSESAGALSPSKDLLVTEAQIGEWAAASGLSLERTVAAGSHHFGLIFKKN